MTSAVIYARVSSARQKKDETIASQTAALRAHAEQLGLEVPEEWVFEDEGHSGATLIRPALERLRDVVAGVGVEVVLCYSPDRLARKFAYQALLIEEFARAGTRVQFVRGPSGDSPEDQLLVQFQGMFAEYEKAQILERYRRGKTHRAKTGSVNVLSGAPFGYRYVRKGDHAGAAYEVVEHEAVLVSELFRRYADEGVSIAELARWLTEQGVPTRTGKRRWDRSVIWGMLRNSAYAGRAVFGKTMVVHESPALNRVARLQGRSTPRASKTVDRPREQWTEIAVPAIVSDETFERVARRLTDNKRFASRNSTTPSLLQGLTACANCGYGYYRTSTRTTNKKIYYYRCLGSDDYRYEGGRVCTNRPVRADYLDAVVWDHITAMLGDPQLIRTEIDKRLATAKFSDPTVTQRKRLELALTKAGAGIAAMVEAFGEQLITIDELRARMPDLRAREVNLRNQIHALDSQLADREAYLALAADLEGFLAQLHDKAEVSTVGERQRVLRLLVKDVLVGADKITIRHRIPIRERTSPDAGDTDTEGEHCPLRWRRKHSPLRGSPVPGSARAIRMEHIGAQPALHVQHDPSFGIGIEVTNKRLDHQLVVDGVEERTHVDLDHPRTLPTPSRAHRHRIQRAAPGAITVGIRVEHLLHPRHQPVRHHRLGDPIGDRRDTQHPLPAVAFRDRHRPHRLRMIRARGHPIPDLVQIVLQIGLELLEALPVHPRSTLVGGHLQPGLPHLPLVDLERLVHHSSYRHHRAPPTATTVAPVDLILTARMGRPLRSTPITGASALLRAGPPPPTSGWFLLFHAVAAVRARAVSMPGTTWPAHWSSARLHPAAVPTPRFRCHRNGFRHVVNGSLTFAFPNPT
ncbi:recombinase family protein [Rhodococcus aetherivorans]|nr:recombinase family protein [Rhodococcus aetherivorans]